MQSVVHYVLPALSYNYDELEPFVDAQTMQLHHLQYHKLYVDELNNTLTRMGGAKHPKYISSILSDLSSAPASERDLLAFFGGGFENHRMLWETMTPPRTLSTLTDVHPDNHHCNYDNDADVSSFVDSSDDIFVVVDDDGGAHFTNNNDSICDVSSFILPKPSGSLENAIYVYFGGFESFQDAFSDKAMSLQGSGWCWLVLNPAYNKLELVTTENNDTPWMFGHIPLLGLDLWEHAYYLKYRNDRLRYIRMWWYVINWKNIESKFVSNTV